MSVVSAQSAEYLFPFDAISDTPIFNALAEAQIARIADHLVEADATTNGLEIMVVGISERVRKVNRVVRGGKGL